MGLHVVGDDCEREVIVRGKHQFAARAFMVVAIHLLPVVLVIDIAVIGAEQGGERAREGVRNQTATQAEARTAFVTGEVRLINVTVGFSCGCTADDVHHPGRGVLAEQRTLRATQDFNAIQVQQVEGRLPRARVDHPIDYRRHGRLNAGRGRDRAHTPHKQRRVLVRGTGSKIQRGNLLDDARDAVAPVSLQLLAIDDGHGHGDFLQRFFATSRTDRDGFKGHRLLIAVGGERQAGRDAQARKKPPRSAQRVRQCVCCPRKSTHDRPAQKVP